MTEENLTIREMQQEAYRYAKQQGFWDNRPTDRPDLFIPQCLFLIGTEVSEAGEAIREDDWDEYGEELADIIIRVGDLAEETGVDLEEEIKKKQKKNWQREKKHGKKF